MFAAGALFVDLPAPRDAIGFAVVLVMGVLSLYGIGLLMASLIPNQRVAPGISWLVFAPCAFLAGVYVPIRFLPDWVVGSLLPSASR